MVAQMRDAALTKADWRKLDKNSIVLKCNYYNVDSRGIKDDLITRLMIRLDELICQDPESDSGSEQGDNDNGDHEPMDVDAVLDGPQPSGTPTDAYGDTSARNTSTSDSGHGEISLGEYSDYSSRSDASSGDGSPRRKRKKAIRKKKGRLLKSVVVVPNNPSDPPAHVGGTTPPPGPSSAPNDVLPPAAPTPAPTSVPTTSNLDPALSLAQAEIRALRSELGRLNAGGNARASAKTTPSAPPSSPRKRSGAPFNPNKRGKKRVRGGGQGSVNNTLSSGLQVSTISTTSAWGARSTRTQPATTPALMSVNVPQPSHPPMPAQAPVYPQQMMYGNAVQPTYATPVQPSYAPQSYGPPPPPPQQPLPQFHIPQVNAGASSSSTGNNNPFLPPSIKVSILKKIHRREFVDFEELLPGNQISSAISKHESCISIDRKSQTLKFDKDKVKKEKVDTLGKWMLAWNAFLQAHLHYHPTDFYRLSCYQKLFCQLANKYKFDACVSYDRYFRLSMANQQTLSADLRSVSWTSVCEEYRAMYLIDNPLPHCFQCKPKGHFAQNCPDRKTTQADTTLSPTLTGQQSNFRRSRPSTQQYQQQPSGYYNQQQAQRFPQFHIPQQQPIQQQQQPQQPQPASAKPCFRFNGTGSCSKPPCPFQHVCSICFRSSHAAKDCYAQSSSTFRPQPQPGNPNGQGP